MSKDGKINYRVVKGKYVFEKDGVYFALTPDQVREMQELLTRIAVDCLPTYVHHSSSSASQQ